MRITLLKEIESPIISTQMLHNALENELSKDTTKAFSNFYRPEWPNNTDQATTYHRQTTTKNKIRSKQWETQEARALGEKNK